ncbi:hypothetical protein [Paenibacillus sp. FSL H7-0331]|uniref:hypothetical protein n=1 Tax=Paenibacillus sp. FSL H7-0331 TaxID=1920421 RepID=UPI00117BE456|nr:hypothetical protein [Paenibacillus sp. FSL H7-0331]
MSIQRPPIGNRGVNTRSFTQQPPSYSLGTQLPNPYPGIGTNSYTPQPQYTPQVVQAAPTPPASGGGGALSKLTSFFGGGGSGAATGASSTINIAQMKQVFDRLGGIDGIMDTMGKVQKMVQSVQQMAPLVKVLMGSFGKKKKDGDSDAPLRRRRRKRTSGKNTSKNRGKRRKAR